MDKMRKLLVDMKKADGEERAKVAWQTLLKYLGNVVKNPDEVKFRAIKLSNEAFQRRVGSATGAIEFLTVCGFQACARHLPPPPSPPFPFHLSTSPKLGATYGRVLPGGACA